MLAWINWEPGGLPRVRRRVELLNGMPLCRVEIGGRITPLLRLFLRRERRILREAGVRQGVWADGLPELLQLELTAVDVTPLRRAILPAIPLLFRYRINCRLAAYSSLIWASSFSPSIYG